MNAATGNEKELLYCWVARDFNVLVPKRRGSGFLKVPYGHHVDQSLDVIADAGRCEVTGLDGALAFECGGEIFNGGDEVRSDFAAIIIPRLESHYGLTAREIDAPDFWRLVPVPYSDKF